METWLPIADYEGYYEISDHAQVRSVDREVSNGRGKYIRHGAMMVPFITDKGYRAYGLSRDGIYTVFLVHRLVYAHFVGDCAGLQVRHKLGDPSKNRPEDLTVGTNADNQQDSVKHGTHHMARKTECKNGHEFDERNTKHYTTPKGGPGRRCRRCAADRQYAKAHGLPSPTPR